MSSKFGSLSADVGASDVCKVTILDPATDLPIKDVNGKEAFIEVEAADGPAGRAFDKEQRVKAMRRARSGRNQNIDDDQQEVNQQKTARLTRRWHLVDPESRQVIDVPCNEDAAFELYSSPSIITRAIWLQVWVAANDAANFIKRSSTTSAPSPSTVSDKPASATTDQA